MLRPIAGGIIFQIFQNAINIFFTAPIRRLQFQNLNSILKTCLVLFRLSSEVAGYGVRLETFTFGSNKKLNFKD